MLRSAPMPTFHTRSASTRAPSTHTTVEKATPSRLATGLRPEAGAISAQALDDQGVGHAAAFPLRLEAVAPPRALELVQRGGRGASAGAAERVPEGDGPAVDVHLLHVRVMLLLPGQDHRRERLIDLDE